MRFKDFILNEEKEKHAVLAFGRMNPPTTGHQVLVNKVHDIAKKNNASHHVVLSGTQDKAKNPLSSAQKLKHAQRFFPKTNLTVATKEHPNFLKQAEKLHKKGVTHLHMVAGSDRTEEFDNLLHKYNGTHNGALFNFKHIQVHSAGERDPDAEGTTGMSASKMRSHASSGNYDEFKKGIPSHVRDHHAKEMYHDVRKGMNVKEQFKLDIPLDILIEDFLNEGVHDKAIFKAVFLSGGPGSGKDYVLSNTLDGHGLIEINSDKALEYLMDKEKLDKKMPESEKQEREFVRGRAKSVTDVKEKLAIHGRNGLIINGTGDDVKKIADIKKRLEDMGYDTKMVAVNTADEVSKQRNIERGKSGGRTVPEEIRSKKWKAVENARPELAKLFGNDYTEFDNSEDLREAPPEVVKQKKDEMMQIFKSVREFVSKPSKNEKSKEWIASELSKKDTLSVSKSGTEKTPSKDSKAYQQAMKLGLQYFGFGRYGKNGKVSHHSVHDELVQDVNEQFLEILDDEFENLLSEEVTISVSADTPEEAIRTIQLLKGESEEPEYDETLSTQDAKSILTLGSNFSIIEPQVSAGSVNIMPKLNTEEVKYMTDSKGKRRIFILRAAAAKEAHVNGGYVEKVKSGYVVKLKENLIVSRNNQTIQEIFQERSGSNSARTLSEETINRKKISITEAKKKYKEKLSEIDRGIEPGMSMASSGENLSRASSINPSNKLKTALEMTGDTTTASIGDQKELELKRNGIDLQTFKANRSISS